MSGPVVGIDLGTTNTVVGIVQDGQAKAIADTGGDSLIPSVVSFHPGGNVLVGKQAKERRLIDAANTIYSVKRLIGRSWESDEVKRARSRFPFEMREGPGQAALVVARGETYTLPEISAFVLRKAKAIAEEALGATIERAVITVPANFNDLQRAATKVAGRVAGLEVLRILNEPTAAALAYGYGKGSTERIAIYDFGGGTFDVTLLDLSGNVFEVLATAGNTFLGGDDVDLAIAERMADAFLVKHRSDPRDNPQGFERLRAAAEQLKIDLSGQPRAAVSVDEVAHGPGGSSLNLDFSMTRREFDELSAPFVSQTFDVCREALSIARLEPKDFDQVLLVGGSTRIPLVKEQVERFFGRKVIEHISPDEVVAIGAAIQASALTGAERRRAEIPRPPLPAARTSQSLALGQTMQIPPSSLPRGSEPPPLPKRRTSPGIRPGAQTSPGVYSGGPGHARPKTIPPGQRRGSQPPMVIQPPGGPAQEPIPHTADGPGATRRRQITGMGLGAPPQAQPPPRGRMPTGSGLGGPPPRRIPTGAGLGPLPEPRKAMPTGDYGTPGPAARPRPTGDAGIDAARQRIPTGRGLGGEVGTLMSAGEAAQSAKAAARDSTDATRDSTDATRDSTDNAWADNLPPLPLVGVADHNQDDLTVPVSDSVASRLTPGAAPPPLPKAAAALGATALIPALVHTPSEADQMRAKYGNLPLIMPGDGAAPALSKSTLPSSQMPELEDLADVALDLSTAAEQDDELELPTSPADLQPAQRGFGSTMLLDTDSGAQFSAESLAAAELRQYAAPTSTDEVTLVRHAVSVSPSGTFEFEDELPIPDLPPSAEQTQVGRDPLGETVKRQVPAGLGATLAMQGPTGTALLNQQPNQPVNFAETAKAIQSPLYDLPPQRPAMPTAMGLGAPGQPVIREMPGHPRPYGSAENTAPAPARAALSSAPLLVDVTPLSLNVETVSGYCDRIINRNTPVPCEETRKFVTARDNQTVVRLRIGQGESRRFEDNTLLGELELAGLRPAARGQIAIAVTFSLDTDGMLNVTARDTHTGQATSAVMRLVGLDISDVAAMQARHQAHAM